MARTTSLDDMHSENIWFSWYKPSKYREKLICHACDGRTNGGGGGKWKIGQCSVGPETAIVTPIWKCSTSQWFTSTHLIWAMSNSTVKYMLIKNRNASKFQENTKTVISKDGHYRATLVYEFFSLIELRAK